MKTIAKVIESMLSQDATRPWTVPATGGAGATSVWGWGGYADQDTSSVWGWGGVVDTDSLV